MGEWVSAKAAKPVRELYGKTGPAGEELPAADTPVFADLSYFMHEGEHTTLPIDYQTIVDFLDRHFEK